MTPNCCRECTISICVRLRPYLCVEGLSHSFVQGEACSLWLTSLTTYQFRKVRWWMAESKCEICKHWLGDDLPVGRLAFFWILSVRFNLLKHR